MILAKIDGRAATALLHSDNHVHVSFHARQTDLRVNAYRAEASEQLTEHVVVGLGVEGADASVFLSDEQAAALHAALGSVLAKKRESVA